jgi:hypothetical protein
VRWRLVEQQFDADVATAPTAPTASAAATA